MSAAEVVRLPDRGEVEAPESPLALVPPHVVQAIARAAILAYRDAERAKRREYARAYYRLNKDRILERARERAAMKRLHPVPRKGDAEG